MLTRTTTDPSALARYSISRATSFWRRCRGATLKIVAYFSVDWCFWPCVFMRLQEQVVWQATWWTSWKWTTRDEVHPRPQRLRLLERLQHAIQGPIKFETLWRGRSFLESRPRAYTSTGLPSTMEVFFEFKRKFWDCVVIFVFVFASLLSLWWTVHNPPHPNLLIYKLSFMLRWVSFLSPCVSLFNSLGTK